MPIDVIRNAPGSGGRASHMVRAGTEMVIREGRNPDGERITVYTAMGVCGTEATGHIAATEIANDVSCGRCKGRAERELAPRPEPMVQGSHGWDDAPVLASPEVIEPPTVTVTGRQRHGAIVHERSERRRKMKELSRK